MSKLKIFAIILTLLIGFSATLFFVKKNPIKEITDNLKDQTITTLDKKVEEIINEGGLEKQLHPLSIEALGKGDYPGSDIVIEQTLTSGSNYQRYIASYKSEGLKIYALLTIPNPSTSSEQVKPESGPAQRSLSEVGWPVVIFNHGYIPPTQYRTTERYLTYTDAFSRNGYILFRPDYRGHGNSEGNAAGGYGSNAYTIDVLNALASIKKHPDADANRIGMWGHSMGGHITLRSMVVNKDIKAGVIWAGVVASYPDLLNNWRRRNTQNPSPSPLPGNTNSRRWRDALVSEYGEPETNPEFWNSISSNSYLEDISGPIQLHHGTRDSSVPILFSQKLDGQLKDAGKEVEFYAYQGDDHNLSSNLYTALQRSVDFFNKNLK